MAKVFLYISVIVGLCSLFLTCKAALYIVGDTAGWEISQDYDSWASGKTFKVGDVLVFQYSSLHSVMVVNKDDYDSCSTDNVIQSNRGGNTSIPLTSPGPKYFICGTISHCLGGMKLPVNVEGNQATSRAPAPVLAPQQSPPSLPRPSSKSNNPLPTVPRSGSSRTATGCVLAFGTSILGVLVLLISV